MLFRLLSAPFPEFLLHTAEVCKNFPPTDSDSLWKKIAATLPGVADKIWNAGIAFLGEDFLEMASRLKAELRSASR